MCTYKSDRKDRFDRHMKQTHFKIKKKCECGKEINASGWSKHKKKHCPLREEAWIHRLESSTEIFDSSVSSTSFGSNDSTKENSHLISSVVHKIETNVRVNTYSDGEVIVIPGELKIGNQTFVVTKKFGQRSPGK